MKKKGYSDRDTFGFTMNDMYEIECYLKEFGTEIKAGMDMKSWDNWIRTILGGK